MRIKSQYLNEETLCPYGFEKKEMFDGLNEWWKHGEYSSVSVLSSGKIIVCIRRPYTAALIDDVIYRLIADKLVEIEE